MGRDELMAEIERLLGRLCEKELDVAAKLVKELVCLRRRKPDGSGKPKKMSD